MSKGHIDIVAIDLKVCLVIATVSDFEGRHHPDDVELNETKPAIGSGPQLRPGSDIETMLAKRACVSKAKRSA